MTQPPTGLNLRGAIDLSALSQPAPTTQGGGAAASGVVVEITAETFQQVVTTSMNVPVVVDLYSARSAASTELSATLQQLAEAYGGRFQLARVDADANPQIAQAVGAQALPTTFAIIKGQPLPLFQGSYPAEQIQAVLDQLLRAAAENGVTGTVSAEPADGDEEQEPQEPPLPPHLQQAYDAVEAGDLETAAAVLTQAIKEAPADAEAKAMLAQVQLMSRLESVDPVAALTAARDAAPGDLEVQLTAADVELSTGQAAAAYARLLAAVRATSGDDRDAARARLVELFLLAEPDDPAVLKARRDLALALY